MTAGVRQGSVLGPSLWNVTYDDFLGIKIQEGATLVGFADDLAIVIIAETAGELEIKANDSLNRVNLWLMPNIGGPRKMKRRLLNSVVHSKISYASPIWVEAM